MCRCSARSGGPQTAAQASRSHLYGASTQCSMDCHLTQVDETCCLAGDHDRPGRELHSLGPSQQWRPPGLCSLGDMLASPHTCWLNAPLWYHVFVLIPFWRLAPGQTDHMGDMVDSGLDNGCKSVPNRHHNAGLQVQQSSAHMTNGVPEDSGAVLPK